MTFDIIKAVILGIVEGLTEFIPVSSTGHLLLVERVFGFADDDFGKSFAVLIQFGAILALLSIYSIRIWNIAAGFFVDPAARRFVAGVLLAFLPAAIVGALAHDFIKTVLFNAWIGVIQCFSMIPGVSRSGATIVGAMVFGADRRSAAEFSFWLAMPTMAGAFAYDLYKTHAQLSANNLFIIAIGFAVSFVSAWIVVKTFLGYVQRHGFALFAWWRVIAGSLGLIALALGW